MSKFYETKDDMIMDCYNKPEMFGQTGYVEFNGYDDFEEFIQEGSYNFDNFIFSIIGTEYMQMIPLEYGANYLSWATYDNNNDTIPRIKVYDNGEIIYM